MCVPFHNNVHVLFVRYGSNNVYTYGTRTVKNDCENQWHIQCWLLWTLVVRNLHIVYFRHKMRSAYGKITYATVHTLLFGHTLDTAAGREIMLHDLWVDGMMKGYRNVAVIIELDIFFGGYGSIGHWVNLSASLSQVR